MARDIHRALTTWASDSRIHFVLLDGAGERGLCAGGDIRALYKAVVAGHENVAADFFCNEYRFNYYVSRYSKPYIALMNGIVMGGGVGVSAHGSHRIVTERSQVAMPETGIGFIPDVGGTYLLGTAPGEYGTYLGLTGSSIGAADAIYCGLADLMVRSESLPALTEDLEACDDAAAVDACLRRYASPAPPGKAVEQAVWIRECFAADTVEEIFAALARHPHPEAGGASEELKKKSPTSLKITLAALRNARETSDLAACLEQEYRIALVCLQRHDFLEGVRAAIIDKDRKPRWHPQQLAEVPAEEVRRYFAETPDGGLQLSRNLDVG